MGNEPDTFIMKRELECVIGLKLTGSYHDSLLRSRKKVKKMLKNNSTLKEEMT